MPEEETMKRMLVWSITLTTIFSWANLAAADEKPKAPPANLPKGVKFLGDLAYVDHGHERNRLDLYLPEKADGRLPLIVWIHGGGWQAGSKDGCPAMSFVAKGYAVASINYRLSQHAVFPAQIEDCKAAIRWLRANAAKYHIDPEQVGVWGASAGGHLVALLGTTAGAKELEGKGGNANQSSRVQCVVDFFGPTDFVHWDPDFNKAVYTMITNLLGGKANENAAKARAASPLFYADKDSAPLLIVHGDKDPLVPLNQSEALVEAMKKSGVEAKLVVIKNGGHGGPGFDTPENRKLIEEFFAKHLAKTEGKRQASASK
jgi:acetyl esterase/lipase